MFKTYQKLLKDFVALPSVSASPRSQPDMKRTVAWLQQLFEQYGFSVTLLTDGQSNPVVVAKYTIARAATTLIYGHYDVQPAELAQGWSSDPFQLLEADGRLFGRGSVDNKGQILVHMVSIFELLRRGQLRTNVTFLIEGNEETANPGLDELIKKNQRLLACDQIIISDGAMRAGRPTIEASLRGGYNAGVRIRTATNDLHSGLVGGAVPSASSTLVNILGSLFDEQGQVLVKGFYAGMMAVDARTEAQNAQLAGKLDPFSNFGVKKLVSANETDFYTQTGLYPTLQITGLTAGYTGDGFANIVPASAEARLNIRTVVGQDPRKNADQLRRHLSKHKPDYAELEIQVEAEHNAVQLDTDSPTAQSAKKLLESIYGQAVVLSYVGGAVPVVSDFKTIFGIDPLLIPFGNEDCNMHGANENFSITAIKKALEFSYQWFGREQSNKS